MRLTAAAYTICARLVFAVLATCLHSATGAAPDLLSRPQIQQLWTAAEAAFARGDYRAAREDLERAYVAAQISIPDEESVIVALAVNLAVVDQSLGRTADAAHRLAEAFERQRRLLGPEHRDTLSTQNNLGHVYIALGRYSEARQFLERTLEARSRTIGPGDPDTLDTRNNLAGLYLTEGRYDEAERFLLETLDPAQPNPVARHPSMLRAKGNLASAYVAQGRYGAAEPLLVEVLEGRSRVLGAPHPETLISSGNLAYLYALQGRYSEAEPLYRATLELQLKRLPRGHPDTTATLNNLAGLYYSQRRYAQAEHVLEETLKIAVEVQGHEHVDILKNRNNLALLYMAQHRYDEAEKLWMAVQEVRQRKLGMDHPETLTSHHNLAMLAYARGQYDVAASRFRATLEISDRVLGRDHPDTLMSRQNLIAVLAAKEPPDLAGAAAHARMALAGMRSRQKQELETAQTGLRRAQILGDHSLLDLVLTLAANSHAELAAEALLRTKGTGGEFEAALRAASASDPTLGDLPARLQTAESQLSRLEVLDDVAAMRAARAARDALERELTQRSATFRAAMASGEQAPSELARTLPAKAVFLDFAIYQPLDFKSGRRQAPRVYVALYRQGQVRGADLGPFADLKDDIERLARAGRLELLEECGDSEMRSGCPNAAERKDLLELVSQGRLPSDEVDAARGRLAASLLAPLGDIEPGTALVVALDGALHRLNFGMLLRSGDTLLENGPLRMVANGRTLAREKLQAPAGGRLFALGGAAYGPVSPDRTCSRTDMRTGGYCPLPHAANEARAISAIARDAGLEVSGPFYEERATEAAVKQGLPGARIAHLATHGTIARPSLDSPLNRVALLFAGANHTLLRGSTSSGEDGVLHGHEASRVPLRGTELVVLSACETALGEPAGSDGMYSMAHAFRLAGAQHVLMSLWGVDDVKTEEFMTIFYRKWLGDGLALGEAFRQTQIDAKHRRGWGRRHWAAFVLVEN